MAVGDCRRALAFLAAVGTDRPGSPQLSSRRFEPGCGERRAHELLVLRAGTAADADGADAALILEGGQPAPEEGEEGVEACESVWAESHQRRAQFVDGDACSAEVARLAAVGTVT